MTSPLDPAEGRRLLAAAEAEPPSDGMDLAMYAISGLPDLLDAYEERGGLLVKREEDDAADLAVLAEVEHLSFTAWAVETKSLREERARSRVAIDSLKKQVIEEHGRSFNRMGDALNAALAVSGSLKASLRTMAQRYSETSAEVERLKGSLVGILCSKCGGVLGSQYHNGCKCD
jgi:hypothetical protein